jgi:two-component system nitrate/nitrite response regulator NarL
MRLLICDHHVVFAESLAHLLTARGYDVTGITHHPDRLIELLSREPVDICLLDVVFGGNSIVDRLPSLRTASPGTQFVLVTAGVDAALLSAARGAAAPLPVSSFRRHANDAVRLGSFLTPREREVLCGLVRGDDTKKLARSMGIASATARCHIQNVLTKLGAHSRLEAATSAVRYGLVSPETGDWLPETQWASTTRAG